jgi:hypothetical protein
VNKTFVVGRKVNTMTFEMVANAKIVRSDNGWLGNCPDRLKGSKVQTSPRLPLKIHLELYPLMPRVRLNEISNTEPPALLISARAWSSVNLKF